MAFFLADESPDFIELELLAWQGTHFAVQKGSAALTHAHTKTRDRIPMNTRHSLDCPNTGAFR
jgi:hypothetical protein